MNASDIGISAAEAEANMRRVGKVLNGIPEIGGKSLDEWELWFACIDANDETAKSIVVNTYLPEGHDWRVRIQTRYWE